MRTKLLLARRFISPIPLLIFIYFSCSSVFASNKLNHLSKVSLISRKINADTIEIGYGEIKKTELTNSVGQVNVEGISKAPVSSFLEALAGRVAGVQVSSKDGQPGGSMNIMIRGANSLIFGTSPLYVIDGFPVEKFNLLTINPQDIEKITILKDGASTAIYGVKGSNGVVLIKTKRGNISKPRITLSSSLGVQYDLNRMELMNPYEFVKYQQELNTTASNFKYFSSSKSLESYKNIEGIDWQDKILRRGSIGIHNLSIRGGSEQTQYAISGSFFDQNGVVINTGLNRYTGKLNLDQTINNKLKVGLTTNYSEVTSSGATISKSINGSKETTSYLLARSWLYRPTEGNSTIDLLNAPMDNDATEAGTIRFNPFLDLTNQHQKNITELLMANGYINYNIIKNLTFRSTIGIRKDNIRKERFYNSNTSEGSGSKKINGSMQFIEGQNILNENTINYKKAFNSGHTINGLGLFAISKFKVDTNGYSSQYIPNETLGIYGLDEGIPSKIITRGMNLKTTSYAGKLGYDYKARYLATFSLRADKQKYSHQWDYAPGVGMAWNMTEESFFKRTFPFISASKLRASYGSNRNGLINEYSYIIWTSTTMGPSAINYSTNELKDLRIRREKIRTIDIGYELGILDNRFFLEIDLYRKVADGYPMIMATPNTNGLNYRIEDFGKLKNEGLELTLNTINISQGTFNWQSSFNISFNRNQVMSIMTNQKKEFSYVNSAPGFNSPLYVTEVGKPLGMMYGVIWDGNYQYEDFDNPAPGLYILKNSVSSNGSIRESIQPGDIKYKDLNQDGTINEYDKAIIGRGQPIHTGGFSNILNYKNFSMNLFLQWSYGNDIYNANRLVFEGNSNNRTDMNQFASYINRWSPQNQTNENYRAGGQGPGGIYSSRVVEDGSYLRLKTLSFAYTIPQRYIQKYLRSLSLNITGQNLITWTKYSGGDPEVSTQNYTLNPGYDFSPYPQARTIVMGLAATF